MPNDSERRTDRVSDLEADAHAYRLLQAAALLRQAGYVERNGNWFPSDDFPSDD